MSSRDPASERSESSSHPTTATLSRSARSSRSPERPARTIQTAITHPVSSKTQVWSTTGASGPFGFIDSIPVSIADVDEYISDRQMISPLAALRTR